MQLNTLAYPLTHAMNLDLDTQFTPLSFDVEVVSWWNVKDIFNEIVVPLAFKQFLITSSLPNQVTQYDLPILKVNDYGCPPFYHRMDLALHLKPFLCLKNFISKTRQLYTHFASSSTIHFFFKLFS
jgi:hypothetical protein